MLLKEIEKYERAKEHEYDRSRKDYRFLYGYGQKDDHNDTNEIKDFKETQETKHIKRTQILEDIQRMLQVPRISFPIEVCAIIVLLVFLLLVLGVFVLGRDESS